MPIKHLFILILFTFMLTGAIAQVTEKINLSKDNVAADPANLSFNQIDSLKNIQFEINKMKLELDFVRHCLHKSHNEKMGGYMLSFFGGVIMGLSTGLTNTDVSYNGTRTNDFSTEGKLVLIGGAGLSLIGTFMIIDSEKWLKRAYTGPDGLGIKYEF